MQKKPHQLDYGRAPQPEPWQIEVFVLRLLGGIAAIAYVGLLAWWLVFR